MTSKDFIQTKLSNRTNAIGSTVEAKNNRWHYHLRFPESIGWDWVYGQVKKAEAEVETELELWEIHPDDADTFSIEVREVERREGIDEAQRGLETFK